MNNTCTYFYEILKINRGIFGRLKIKKKCNSKMESHIDLRFLSKISYDKGNTSTEFQKIKKINRGSFWGSKI